MQTYFFPLILYESCVCVCVCVQDWELYVSLEEFYSFVSSVEGR